MSSSNSQARDLTRYPTSISGDQIVKNIAQVGQSDGVDPVSLEHAYCGISRSGTVFSMASFRVVESGPNTNRGTLELHVYNSDGLSIPVLTIGEDGMTISGSLNVVGGNASFETTSIDTADKDIVLGSGATSLEEIDNGGIILGASGSGTRTLLYDSARDVWKTNIGVGIDAGAAFSVGEDAAVLDATGLTIGDAVSLTAMGLEMEHASLTPLGGLVVRNADSPEYDAVVVDASGVTIGDEYAPTKSILTGDGLYLNNADSAVFLGETAWKIAYDSSSRHLLFKLYDTESDSYVTKAEISS
ncbi:unnamed protein product [Pylaiella littoralis]